MTFILIRFSSMGDIILQTPVAAWLKFKFPKCRILFVTAWEFRSLVQNHPFIDDVYSIKRLKGKEDRNQLKELAQKIDTIEGEKILIDLHNTLRAKFIRFNLKNTLCVAVPKRSILRKILIQFKIDLLKNLPSHHERVLNDLSFFLSQDFDRGELEDFISQKTYGETKTLTTLPQSFCLPDRSSLNLLLPKKYIVIAPIASFPNKRWPIENFNEFCLRFLSLKEFQDFSIVLVAGPNDTYCSQVEMNGLENEVRFINLQGKTNITGTTAVIREADLVLSNDTATVHIAEALDKRVLALFGPTHESFGFRPHLNKNKTASVQISCRPCSGTGKDKCSQPSLLCMEKISVSRVLDEVLEMLESS